MPRPQSSHRQPDLFSPKDPPVPIAAFDRVKLLPLGLSRDWGSCRDGCWWVRVVGGLEALPEAEAERAVVDGAADLEQPVGATPRCLRSPINEPESTLLDPHPQSRGGPASEPPNGWFGCCPARGAPNSLAEDAQQIDPGLKITGIRQCRFMKLETRRHKIGNGPSQWTEALLPNGGPLANGRFRSRQRILRRLWVW